MVRQKDFPHLRQKPGAAVMTGDGFSMTPSVIHIPVLLITLITKRICIKSGIFLS